jgi:hypothetical protein
VRRSPPSWLFGLLLLPILHAPQGASALQTDPLALQVQATDGGVRVSLAGALEDGGLQRALEAGLPLRIRLVAELWRDRFFDSQEGRYEWRATVRFDPLGGVYRVDLAEDVVLQAGSLTEVAVGLEAALRVPLRPMQPGTYYYLARLEMETLALSDLEELQRWLRGELAPSIGEAEVGSALGRGLRRIFVRVLGVPVRRLQARTPRFNWEG